MTAVPWDPPASTETDRSDIWDLIDNHRPEWFDYAACLGLGAKFFYPESDENEGRTPHGNYPKALRQLCAGCPVRQECLEYGLNETHGVWGGTSPKERRRIRERGTPGSTVQPIRHGSESGYKAHRDRGIPPCPVCVQAHSAYRRARTAALRDMGFCYECANGDHAECRIWGCVCGRCRPGVLIGSS